MAAVRPERQRFCPDHGIERQIAIKMWKKRAAARRLEAQAVAKSFCVDRDKQQIVLAAEIVRGGRFGLLRGRKMNVTVGDIDQRAGKTGSCPGLCATRRQVQFYKSVSWSSPLRRKNAVLYLPVARSHPCARNSACLRTRSPLKASAMSLRVSAIP
jgi:hypothetical protein